MPAEADHPSLSIAIDHPISELHNDLPDPLSAVIHREDPFLSIDQWRRDVVDCDSPIHRPLDLVEDTDSILPHGLLSLLAEGSRVDITFPERDVCRSTDVSCMTGSSILSP
ncbi:hypothetical protein ID866_7156 [Astraeus odoratus]|nr:hypothetical protein ID866_7156 [Astraeus odoratus]